MLKFIQNTSILIAYNYCDKVLFKNENQKEIIMIRVILFHDGMNIRDEEKEEYDVKDKISICSDNLSDYNAGVLALTADKLKGLQQLLGNSDLLWVEILNEMSFEYA